MKDEYVLLKRIKAVDCQKGSNVLVKFDNSINATMTFTEQNSPIIFIDDWQEENAYVWVKQELHGCDTCVRYADCLYSLQENIDCPMWEAKLKLLPCPLCGEEAIYNASAFLDTHCIVCSGCNLATSDYIVGKPSKEGLIKFWNTRHKGE